MTSTADIADTADTAVTVVLGPKTQLGRTVVEQLRGREPLLLVARDADDAAAVRSEVGGPGVEVVDASAEDVGTQVGRAAGPVRVVVAALGPVRPWMRDGVAAESPRVVRDLTVLDQVLATGLPAHVVLVSTVVALAPGDDRRSYGGWKNVVEDEVARRVDGHPGCTLTILYPGRLVEPSRKPWLRVHTRYPRLAELVLAADPGRARSRVVGIDSRIWLLARSISFASRSLTGQWSRG